MIVEKEMFLDVDGKQVGMEMTECQLGSEFHRSDAATGTERRPTVVSRNYFSYNLTSFAVLCLRLQKKRRTYVQ